MDSSMASLLAELPKRPELFTSASAKRAATRVTRSEGFEVFPDLHSMSPKYLALCLDLAENLSDSLPVDNNSEGVAGTNAITSDFYQLLTVAGTYMDPMTIPPKNNRAIREEYGLSDRFITTRHKQIWDSLFSLMFRSGRTSAPVKLPKRSSTCFTEFTSDIAYRQSLFNYTFENLDAILDLVGKGDLERALSDHSFVMAYYLGVRAQPDSVKRTSDGFISKPREVTDLEYALTSGRHGKRFSASKVVRTEGQEIPNHFASRRRTVYGMAAPTNLVLAAFFAGWRDHFSSRYSFTWKHKGHRQVEDKAKSYAHYCGTDVKGFDITVADWMIDYFVQSFEGVLDSRVIHMMGMAFKAPYYSTDPTVNGRDHFWIADPLNPNDFDLCVGLPSGIAPNPDFGKFVMTATYLCVLDDYFKDVLEVGVDVILQGKHPTYALLNMGDDCVLLSESQSFVRTLHAMWKEGDLVSPYFLIEKEEGVAFLGGVFHEPLPGQLAVVPDIVSLARNTLWAEWSYTDPRRMNWAHGWNEKKFYYSDAPMYAHVLDEINRAFERHVGRSLDALAYDYTQSHRAPALALLTNADRQVFIDPDKLYYRFDVEDISPHVLDQLVHKIPADIVDSAIERFLL